MNKLNENDQLKKKNFHSLLCDEHCINNMYSQSNIAQVLDTSDSRVNTITTEFDKERLTMESTLSEARQQVQFVIKLICNLGC